MKYEKVKFPVGDEQFDVIHCLGDGQCECKSCKEKGKWNVSWTSWFYKLSEDEDEGVMCGDCLRENLIQRRINKAVKETAKEIYALMTGEYELYIPTEIAKEIAERFGVEVENE